MHQESGAFKGNARKYIREYLGLKSTRRVHYGRTCNLSVDEKAHLVFV